MDQATLVELTKNLEVIEAFYHFFLRVIYSLSISEIKIRGKWNEGDVVVQ